MKTIELSKCVSELPVVENLKNFAGIDAQNALAMMTPERLAAVVGGMLPIPSRRISFDLKPGEVYTSEPIYGIFEVRAPRLASSFALMRVVSTQTTELAYVADIKSGAISTDINTNFMYVYKNNPNAGISIKNNTSEPQPVNFTLLS